MTPCFYKPGPAERAYYRARQAWREGDETAELSALWLAMMAEREELCRDQ